MKERKKHHVTIESRPTVKSRRVKWWRLFMTTRLFIEKQYQRVLLQVTARTARIGPILFYCLIKKQCSARIVPNEVGESGNSGCRNFCGRGAWMWGADDVRMERRGPWAQLKRWGSSPQYIHTLPAIRALSIKEIIMRKILLAGIPSLSL